MKEIFRENRRDVLELGFGALFFAAGLLIHHSGVLFPGFDLVLFVIAYLILGLSIIVEAVRNLFGGHFFDENFLMSVASLAAFAIGEYPEAVGVMLFYRIGEFFEDVAVDRSRSQIMDAVDMRPEEVIILDGEEERRIPAENAQVGDLIRIRPGDRIPLDGVVLEGTSRIDTSPVTGEPVPVSVEAGSELISGCVNEQGVLLMRVAKPLSESMVTRILHSVEQAEQNKPRMDRFITRFAKIYTPLVVLAAILIALVPSLLTGQWHDWVYTAITFLVISCPCALVLSVPLAYFSGIGAASREGILFKGGASIEALAQVKSVAMDKTGTVTEGKFEVRQVVTYGDWTESQILSLAAACELDSTHPIGQSIVEAAHQAQLVIVRPSQVEEISGKGIRARTEAGEILCGSASLLVQDTVDLSAYREGTYGTEVLLAVDGTLSGVIRIADAVKADAAASVARMKARGLTTAMITGDTPVAARAVAEATGIQEVYAKLLPEEKLDRLGRIRKAHGPVLYVGDGINDAPVLAGADVGAAMGSGADAAIEAADVVFMNAHVSAIPQALHLAHVTGHIAVENVVVALAVKAIIMALGLIGFANMWLAVFADTGVAMLCVLNSIRILWKK